MVILLVFISLYSQNIVLSINSIVLPLYYTNFYEPSLFDPRQIITYYARNDIYTSIKIGNPLKNLGIILDDTDCGFVLKEDQCEYISDYILSGSYTLKYNEELFYQSFNYELKNVLNDTRDKIYLNQVDKEYFNLTLKDKKDGKNSNIIEIDDFNFLYIPDNKELEFIYKRKKEGGKIIPEKEMKKEEPKKIGEKQNYVYAYDGLYENDYEDETNYNLPFNQYYEEEEEVGEIDVFSPKCAYMGLLSKGMNNGLTDSKVNFIKQLKEKKIIDNYYWYINFNKDKTGELIIGAAPHEINPEKYPEEDLYMIHSKLINDLFFWEIDFTKVEINDINSNQRYPLHKKDMIISLKDNYIFCPKEYYDRITEIFFKQYFDTFKCKKDDIYEYDSKYTVIYCNFTENELNKFPSLLLKSVELNYVFNLDYNDLFHKTRNVYIFKVIQGMDNNVWKLGKVLLEKYQFVFNYDSKMFGFYHKSMTEKQDDNKEEDMN